MKLFFGCARTSSKRVSALVSCARRREDLFITKSLAKAPPREIYTKLCRDQPPRRASRALTRRVLLVYRQRGLAVAACRLPAQARDLYRNRTPHLRAPATQKQPLLLQRLRLPNALRVR